MGRFYSTPTRPADAVPGCADVPVEGSSPVMERRKPEMTAGDAVDLLQLFARHRIELWVDGGWGVDALLGEQTRPHADLDIALQHEDVPALRALLEARGYRDVPRDDTRDCNFVLGDVEGREVDVHWYTFDTEGRCVFGVEYPAESLTGHGSIAGCPVQCIAPGCRRFGLELPAEYRAFERS